ALSKKTSGEKQEPAVQTTRKFLEEPSNYKAVIHYALLVERYRDFAASERDHGGGIRSPRTGRTLEGPEVRIHFPPAASQVRTCLSREFASLRLATATGSASCSY